MLHPGSQPFPQPRAKGLGSKFPRLPWRREKGGCLARKVCAEGVPLVGAAVYSIPAGQPREPATSVPASSGHSAAALTSLARAAAAASGSCQAPSFPGEDGGVCRETTHSSVWQPGGDSGCSALKLEEEEDEEEEEEGTAQSDAICCTPLRIHWLPGASPGAAGCRAAGSHLEPSLPQQLLRCPSLTPFPPPSSLLGSLLLFPGLVHPSDPRALQPVPPETAGATGLTPLNSPALLHTTVFTTLKLLRCRCCLEEGDSTAGSST
ncbi:hypothetical protein NN561_000845 [Cricetulus griseus]